MGNPTICICKKKKTQISFAVTAKLIVAFVFATRIAYFLFFLNPKFQASSSSLCLYSTVCVRPVQKPHCWFSHEAAQIMPLLRFFFVLFFFPKMLQTLLLHHGLLYNASLGIFTRSSYYSRACEQVSCPNTLVHFNMQITYIRLSSTAWL